MIISEENKYIYIAVPKTGTYSTHQFLLASDETAVRDTLFADGVEHNILGHTKARDIQDILGLARFSEFRIFAFIRNPYGRIVSSYYFYRKGGKAWLFKEGRKRPLKLTLKIWSTYVLPFKLWALVYPYTGNYEYLHDTYGNLLATHLGKFEQLGKELERIAKEIGIGLDASRLPKSNTSKHEDELGYFKSRIFRKLLKARHRGLSRDLRFYEQNVAQSDG